MKSKIMLVMLLAAASTATAYAAPDRAGKWDLGINVSAANQEDAETGLYIGGNTSYGVNPNLGLGVSAGHTSFELETDNFGEDLGTMNAVPIFFDIYARSNGQESDTVAYLVLGLGAVIWDFDEGSDIVEGYTVEADPSFAVKLGGGFDLFLAPNVALNFEAAYVFANTNVELQSAGNNVFEDETDANFWMAGAGLKFLFA